MDGPFRRTPIVAALALWLSGSIGRAVPPGPAGPIGAGIKELHRGLYERAEEIFRAAAKDADADPEPYLLIAFTYWWRILEDRAIRAFDDPFLSASQEAIDSGERLLSARPQDARALAVAGTARILRFHVEGLRKNYRLAAQDARSGKRLLEDALKGDPELRDAYFALGAYNYYADKIPALAKAIRGFLRLPGGDAESGLTQLRSVAISGSLFRTDARLLLALICGSREEQCYRDAQAHLQKALAENPDSPLILGSIGSLQMRLGYYDEAVLCFERALRAAEGQGGERARQRRSLRLLLAEALAAAWRLDRAEAVLAEAGPEPQTLSARERQIAARVTREIAQKRGQPPSDSGARPARAGELELDVRAALRGQHERRSSEALALLVRAAAEHPDQALPRFIRGRILYLQGRLQEADRELEVAADLAPNPPAWMAGWIELYRGLAQERLGDARAARAHFRRASEVKRFRSAERGLLEMQRGVEPHRLCTPS